MAVPRQVQQAADEAEQQLKQIFQEGQPPPEQGDGAPAGEAPPDLQFQPQSETPPVGEQPPEPEESGWEQKYKTLQGMYNKEVPVLRRQLQQMEADMEAMRRLMAQMHASQQVPQSAPQSAPPTPAQRRVKEADVKDYGEDFIDVVQRASLDAVDPYVAKLEAKLAQFEQMMGGMAQQTQLTVRQQLFEKLTQAVPSWEEINRSGEFISWLDQADPYAGVRRQDLLSQAFEHNDIARVVAFFKGFLRDTGAASEPEQRTPTPAAAGRADLRTMVSPGTARSSTTTPSKSTERIWSQRDIATFYSDVMNGKYRDNAAKKEQIEREIFAAVNEGRVRN